MGGNIPRMTAEVALASRVHFGEFTCVVGSVIRSGDNVCFVLRGHMYVA